MIPDFHLAIRRALATPCNHDLMAVHERGSRLATYQEIRAALVEHGSSLREFATETGRPLTTVVDAAANRRRGPITIQVRKELLLKGEGR